MRFAIICLALMSSIAVGNNSPTIGNPNAYKGGTFIYGVTSYPKSLNYPVSGDLSSYQIFSLILETLCSQDLGTGEFTPLLAEKWDISADKKTFTFYINKKAKFSDGAPVTAKISKHFGILCKTLKTL